MSQRINLLDHGYVELVDSYGNDSTIVGAARVSYQKGTKTVREDKALIDYLVRNYHTSPLEMVEFTFQMRMPIFVARQMVRHRTASLNEESARYSEMQDLFYIPDLSRMQCQSNSNKQGSGSDIIDNPDGSRQLILESSRRAYSEYKQLIENGLSRELARMVLPTNLYTSWVWKCDLNNLLKFLRLRMDSHAQWEIVQYANAMYELIKPVVPYTVEAFEKHMLNSVSFSKDEYEALLELLKNGGEHEVIADYYGLKGSRKNEFLEKLNA